MRRMPSFVLLRTFEAAARLESFSGAAAELNLTPSAISHQIKELESYLERPLFQRMHRRVSLTAEGREFARSLSGTFDAIETAWQELVSPSARHDLIVHCAPSFATNWLGPRIRELVTSYPQINFSILSDAEPLDLVKRREIDVVISYCGYIQREELYTSPLGLDEFVPMCSPQLRATYSSDEEAILSSVPIESRGSCVSWGAWYGIVGLKQPSIPPLNFDRLSMKISAAVDGLGVTLESSSLAEKELASGKLVKLDGIKNGSVFRASHFITVRKRDVDSWKIETLLEWIKNEWNKSAPIQ